jgi:hypothetical protein
VSGAIDFLPHVGFEPVDEQALQGIRTLYYWHVDHTSGWDYRALAGKRGIAVEALRR